MAKQNKKLYSKEQTEKHVLSKQYVNCLQNIKAIVISEGGKKSNFSDETAINLDCVEQSKSKLQKRNANKTMDMVFSFDNEKIIQMILTEFRLNYTNVNNLSKSELDAKISHSKNLLGHQPTIHNVYLFVFQTKLKQQATSVLRRLYSNKPTHKALDITDLYTEYFVS